MIETNSFLGIKFGQSLDLAHKMLISEGFRFIKREEAEAPLGRVLYSGSYLGNDTKLHLDFLRNGFHRARLEISAEKPGLMQDIQADFSRKYGPSQRLTRNRQACTDDSPHGSCFDLWALDDDTSIIMDLTGSPAQPVIVVEFFRIL